jgi:hypothetical protein
MSTFDPAAFEAMVIDEANETKTTPVPDGDYPGLIHKAQVSTITIKSGERAGTEVPILNITWELTDEDGKLAEELNREKVFVRQDIWLDVNEHGGLAFGPNQNVALGRLREAVGMNRKGQSFSFPMLEGAGPCMVHVKTEARQDTGDIINRVPRVSKLA